MHEFWTDELADRVEGRHPAPFVVSDWKTPSGRIHVGALRGVVLHDAAARALRFRNHAVRYIYGFDDFDPFDKVPNYLSQADYIQYLGQPMTTVPAPDEYGVPSGTPTSEQNYARFYADEFERVYRSLGVQSETLRTAELYQAGFFDPAIRLALDNANQIWLAYKTILEQNQSEDRRGRSVAAEFPLNVRCEGCGKLATTVVISWDQIKGVVDYHCPPDTTVAPYVAGCDYRGSVSPFGSAAKLPWKVEWAAKWWLLETDVEGAGKDHYTKGGSRDVSLEIFRRVFANVSPPEARHNPMILEDLFYEWFYLGGAKMSKTVGNVIDPNEIIDQYGLDAFRYFFSRHIPTLDDGDFTWEKFENAYNSELGNDLGNVIQRVASMLTRYQSGVIGQAPQGEHDMSAYHEAMDNLEFNKAMDEV